MNYSNELPLQLLLKCVNCDSEFNSDVESVTTIKVQKNNKSISATADLSASNSQDELVEAIIDAVSYIYGISYRHLLCSFLKSNSKSLLSKEKDYAKTTRVAVDDSNVAVALCSKCSNLLEELYNAFKNFDKASTTRSILKGAIRSFRGERHIADQNLGEDDDTVQVKLEVTEKNDDSDDDDCDWQTSCPAENDQEEVNSNFEETEVKKEAEISQDSDMEYMTNCQVILTRLDSRAPPPQNDKVVDRSYKKASRKNVCPVSPSGRSFTGVKSSGKMLKLRQQRQQMSSNEAAARRLRRRSLKTTKVNDAVPSKRFRWVWCCGIRFVCEYEFEEHKNTRHSGQDSIPCEHCQEVIAIKIMSQHLFGSHNIKSSIPRPTKKVSSETSDGKVFSEENLGGSRHEGSTKQRGYTCQYCGTLIHYVDEFDTHMTQHKEYNEYRKPKKQEFPYICCNLTLPNDDALTRHRQRKHDKSFLKEKCKFCEKYYSKSTLRAHLKQSHNYIVEKEIKTFQCPRCDLKFAGLATLTKHQKRNDHQMDICCGIENCTKVFNTVEAYSNHQKSSHLGELKYPCRFCSKLFRSGNSRISHERLHELKDKIECTECGKACKTKKAFENHVKYHRDTKLGREAWKCKDCGKCFVNSYGLNKHIRIFHREDTKRIFTCEVCGKTTNNMTNMRIHQRIHDPNRIVIVKNKKN